MPSFALVGVLLRRYMKVVIASAQKGSIARAVGIWRLRSTKVCTEPMSESESPYARSTPSFSRYELLRVVKHDAFSRTPVPFFIFAAQTSNLTGPSGLALERSTELARE